MNSKTAVKLYLDIVMAAVFVLLMNIFITGMLWHEVLGLFICALFIMHTVLNFQWIKGVTAGFKRGHIKPAVKFKYALDILLLLLMAAITVSGVFISEVVFAAFEFGNRSFWYLVHLYSARACAALLAIHVGLHLKYLIGVFRNMLESRYALKGFAALLAAVGIAYMLRSILSDGVAASTAVETAAAQNDYYTTESGTTDPASEFIEEEEDDEEDDALSAVTASPAVTDGAITLEDYLSKLVCTGCGKHCSLLSPRCGKGRTQAEAAEVEYNEIY